MTFKPIINGIIQVTGGHDTGKTTFALECGADPSRICFFDHDQKGRATVDQLIADGVEFGAYHDLTALSDGKTELEFFDAVMGIINSIGENQFDAIVFDTWDRFGKCFHPYVVTNPFQFRKKWNPSGKIKGAEQWQEAQRYESEVVNRLAKLAPVVIIVSHLKDFYLNAAKTGKQIPASSRTFNRVPRMRIWLCQNPNSPVPIGLVLKRVDVKRNVEGKGLRTICVLPRKIVPNPEDDSLWDAIERYFENPVGNREPTPGETPDEYELSILDGTLTEGQKHTLELMLKAGAVEKDDDYTNFEKEDPMKEYVDRMKSEGASDARIAWSLKQVLKASYPDIRDVLGLDDVGAAMDLVAEGEDE